MSSQPTTLTTICAIKLEGDSLNTRGVGATLILTAGGQKQYIFHRRSGASCPAWTDRVHFGLGARAAWTAWK